MTSSLNSFSLYITTDQSSPPPLMQHFHPTLTFKPLFPLPPTLYLLPLHPHHCLMLLAVSLHLLFSLPPDSLRILQWNAGDLRARSTHLILLTLFVSRNLSSIHLLLSRSLDSLHHSRSGTLFPDAMHASSSITIFVRHGLSFSELSTSSLSLLNPYSDYVVVKISLNNSSSLSLMFMLPLSPLLQQITEPTPFLPPFFPPPEISSFWGTSITITPLGLKRYF